jgi:hypothetical protein
MLHPVLADWVVKGKEDPSYSRQFQIWLPSSFAVLSVQHLKRNHKIYTGRDVNVDESYLTWTILTLSWSMELSKLHPKFAPFSFLVAKVGSDLKLAMSGIYHSFMSFHACSSEVGHMTIMESQ